MREKNEICHLRLVASRNEFLTFEVDVVHDAVGTNRIDDCLLVMIRDISGHTRFQAENVTRLRNGDRHLYRLKRVALLMSVQCLLVGVCSLDAWN